MWKQHIEALVEAIHPAPHLASLPDTLCIDNVHELSPLNLIPAFLHYSYEWRISIPFFYYNYEWHVLGYPANVRYLYFKLTP